MIPVGLPHFLILSAILFGLGLLAVITKRNAVTVLMGVELIINAANINFIAFARYVDKDASPLDGQMFGVFVI
ncbi:MAG: NADH-quinone oxidoreductase subunit NuoK, partial [candidate division KSB1 bacterium]|nr:NADH-quinone oxidoreductase subunit NuoK [candidate division KSB1 bacterium]